MGELNESEIKKISVYVYVMDDDFNYATGSVYADKRGVRNND